MVHLAIFVNSDRNRGSTGGIGAKISDNMLLTITSIGNIVCVVRQSTQRSEHHGQV